MKKDTLRVLLDVVNNSCMKTPDNCCNDVIICGIICFTIIFLSIFLYFILKNKNSIDNSNSSKDTQDATVPCPKVSINDTFEENFLTFCFEKAKSADDKDQEMKKECWEILKDRYNTKETISVAE